MKSSISKNSEQEQAEKALACAVRQLSRRDHSVAEIVRKLGERGFPPEVSAAVVDRLITAGCLDDRRFAERWAESAVRNGRGYGPRLRLELTRRGVPREIVSDVVAAIAASYGEQETLAGIMARKFAGFDPLAASDRETGRIVAYLQRRGFSTSVIFDLLRSRATAGFPRD